MDMIPALVTVVIVGLTANWLVERSDAKAKQIELKLKNERLAFVRDITAVYKQAGELEDAAHRRAVTEVEEIRTESSKKLENNDKLWAIKLESINDIHTKEVLNLVDLVGRMKDNLEHEEARRVEKIKKENGMHVVKMPLLAHINLQEDPSDLIKNANAILEKYNL